MENSWYETSQGRSNCVTRVGNAYGPMAKGGPTRDCKLTSNNRLFG
jgi:hypothetical protein